MNNGSPDRVASPTLHATVLFTMGVFVATIVMAILFQVEIVARGQGKVVPVDRVQIVQPEFGGQVTAIHVRDGHVVEEGQLLIELDQTVAQAEVNTLMAERGRLETERHRIETIIIVVEEGSLSRSKLLEDALDSFAAIRASADPRYYQEQQRLMLAELRELQDSLAEIDARKIANERAIATSQAAIDRLDGALVIQQERMDSTEALFTRQTISRAAYLDVLDIFTRLQGERDVAVRDLERIASIENTLLAEAQALISALRSRLLQRKGAIDARLFELNEALAGSERALTNTRLYAPMSGTIDQLQIFTIGGVVNAGQELMKIVPGGTEFEIEAIFPHSDIGFMAVGQHANVKLDAFPAERFGTLSGIVTDISADAINTNAQERGYVVRIRPDTPYLESLVETYPLQSGMTSVIDVITGDRRLISYFFAPIAKTVQDSLGER
ncbi:MAG: HlyD family type I secretion periplasmic adaptor subunit [Cyanobacteria bacterium P01_F01_bin.3]